MRIGKLIGVGWMIIGWCLAANLISTQSSLVNQPVKVIAFSFDKLADNSGQLVIHCSQANFNYTSKRKSRQLSLIIYHAQLVPWLTKHFNVFSFKTVVTNFSGKNQVNQVLITVKTKADYQIKFKKDHNKLILRFTHVFTKLDRYQLISLHFSDLPVQQALQQLAQMARVNVIVNDSVTGKVTLRLYHVHFEQALKLIVRMFGLAQRKIGSVYLIAPAAQIAKQEETELITQKKLERLEPLHSQLIRLNYGQANQIAELLSKTKPHILSSRGSISIDKRTNTLWIQDTPQKIHQITQLIHQLDIPVQQVLIEAKIVSLDESEEKQLGIRWGLSHAANGLSGTLIGANQLVAGKAANTIDPLSRLNLDLPANRVGQVGGAASMGIALAKLGSGYLLDLELSALQNNGEAKIISNPKLITLNQKQAIIEAGEEIPFQNITLSGGTAISFKKAVLSLKVTPHITPDHHIILKLQVNQDKRGPEVLAGVPSVDTREIQTQVLINNGQTIVLGGIMQQSSNQVRTRVPFISKLPLLGKLFQNRHHQSKQGELLIFITPRILTS